jgi:hypothetical protein
MTVDPVKVVGLPLEDFYSGHPTVARTIMGSAAATWWGAMPIESGELSHWCYDLNHEPYHGFRLSLSLPCTSARGMVE